MAASAACGRAEGKVGIRFSVGEAVGDGPNKKINACVFNALGARLGCLRLRQSMTKINKLSHQRGIADNGLTQTEASEAITQLAFYVGWPNVFSAMPVAKDVFKKRPH